MPHYLNCSRVFPVTRLKKLPVIATTLALITQERRASNHCLTLTTILSSPDFRLMLSVGRITRIVNSFRVMGPPNGNSGQNMSARGYFSQSQKLNSAQHATTTHKVTALKRWSILNKSLPAKSDVRAIHIYDFDNTLFKTPLPNANIWNGYTIGQLSNPDIFVNGGWWHDSRILAATGEGLEKEEPRAWEGWWNEKIVELIRLSEEQKDALTVLLTGRSESGFSDLIKRMVTAKKLNFDMVSLKPAVGPDNQKFNSTMHFKQEFLKALMETYNKSEEIRIYEDRPKHVAGFRTFLTEYNRKQNGIGGTPTRGPITAEVILVPDQATTLDPVMEVAEVQHLINDHNKAITENKRTGPRQEKLMIKKTVFYTGYMIKNEDAQRLKKLVTIPASMRDSDIKFHGNNIMICSRPCPESLLEKVGGMGAKMTWEVSGTACFENSIWAARLAPVPPTANFYTEHKHPLVVLALRKGARPIDAGRIQNWQPVPPDKAFVFETVVGEKMLLRIEREEHGETEYESLFHNKAGFKRKHPNEEDAYNQQRNNGHGGRNDHKDFHRGRGGGHGRGGRGGGRGGRGGWNQGGHGRGGGKPGRGRGGGHHYKSLDDVAAARANEGGFKQGVSYEDDQRGYQPPSQQQQAPPQGPAAFYNQQAQYQAPPNQQQQQQQQYGGWQGQQGQGQGRPSGGGGGYSAGGVMEAQNYY